MNGRYRPVMNEMIVGEMYIIRLKQTAAKGLSTRSVGGVNLVGVPVKDSQAKENKILFNITKYPFKSCFNPIKNVNK